MWGLMGEVWLLLASRSAMVGAAGFVKILEVTAWGFSFISMR